MNFRLDESLTSIYYSLGADVPGALGVAAALFLLAYAFRGSFMRVFGVTILLLIGSQSWYRPAHELGRYLRWWMLLILVLRGILLAQRTPKPPGEGSPGKLLAAAFGGLAVASSIWADNHTYTLGIALSFVITLIATFWVLWRLSDSIDVVAAACQGALWMALIVFGSGFVWMFVADATNDWGILQMGGWAPGARYSGILFNANMSGLLAMIAIPALVAAPRAWFGRSAFLRIPTLIAASGALYLSGSRSALIGTVLSLVLLFLYRFGFGAALTIALGTVGMYVIVSASDLGDIEQNQSIARFARTKHISTLSGRFELWQEGLDAVEGNEVLGLGWGRSRLLSGADAEDALERGHVAGASNLHSTHVQVLVDVGVTGLVILWMLCAQVLWSGMHLLRQPKSERSVADAMVLACFVATLADSFVHGSILSTGSPSALVFWASAVLILKQADRLRTGVHAPVQSADSAPATAPWPAQSAAGR